MKNHIPKEDIDIMINQANTDGVQKWVVGGAIQNENSVLVLKRHPNDFMGGYVELPSGEVDPGEDLLDALIREIKEETGLDVDSVDSFINTFDYTSGSGKKTRQMNFNVHASGTVYLDGHEHVSHQWVTLQEIDSDDLPMSDAVKEVIRQALS